ncbi:MAG TPA: CoA ester lyase [Roseiarcus sp.]|nr:CoA ester lyase [Roseiarcus sp.]
MSSDFSTLALFLFVPADRPDRWAKAFAAGADAVILDLEDGVAASAKPGARRALREGRDAIDAAPCPILVRVNARSSDDYSLDLDAVRDLGLAGVMLAKAETAADVEATSAATGAPVVALIETARGLAAARLIAAACARIAFGSIDFAADLGTAHTPAALASARSELVLASRLADRPAPIDGVTTSIKDPDLVRADAAHACELGFSGKLLIHPAQIAPAMDGFRPSDDDVAWAERILSARGALGAAAVDGAMVDAPVFLRAEQILRRAARFRLPAA